MTFGFQMETRDGSRLQAQCPSCGKFTGEDGYYAYAPENAEFLSIFCNERCYQNYEAALDADRKADALKERERET